MVLPGRSSSTTSHPLLLAKCHWLPSIRSYLPSRDHYTSSTIQQSLHAIGPSVAALFHLPITWPPITCLPSSFAHLPLFFATHRPLFGVRHTSLVLYYLSVTLYYLPVLPTNRPNYLPSAPRHPWAPSTISSPCRLPANHYLPFAIPHMLLFATRKSPVSTPSGLSLWTLVGCQLLIGSCYRC